MPDQIWTVWWAWVVLGFALGILEVIIPGFIFLGFAIGAVITGAVAGMGLIGLSAAADPDLCGRLGSGLAGAAPGDGGARQSGEGLGPRHQ